MSPLPLSIVYSVPYLSFHAYKILNVRVLSIFGKSEVSKIEL